MKESYKRFVDEDYGIIQKVVPLAHYIKDGNFVCTAMGNISPVICETVGYGSSLESAQDRAVEEYLAKYFCKRKFEIPMAVRNKYVFTFGDVQKDVVERAKKMCIEKAFFDHKLYVSHNDEKDSCRWIVIAKIVKIGNEKRIVIDAYKSFQECEDKLAIKCSIVKNIYYNIGKIVNLPFMAYPGIVNEGMYYTNISLCSTIKEIVYDDKAFFLCLTKIEENKNE